MSRSPRTYSGSLPQATDAALERTQHGRAYLLYSQGRSARRFTHLSKAPEASKDSVGVLLGPPPVHADANVGSRGRALPRDA